MKKLAINFLLTASLACNAQIAEDLFKTKYSKVGLEVGSQYLYTSNQSNAAQYKWTTSRSIYFGLNYNFYQKKNLNIKAALTYSIFDQNSEYLIFDNNAKPIGIAGAEHGPYNLFSLPIDAEYYIKIKRNILLSLNSGLEFTYNPYGSDEGNSSSARGINGFLTEINSIDRAPDFPIQFGIDVGFSLAIATKPMLIKFNAKYHKNFNSYMYEEKSQIIVNGVPLAQDNKSTLTGDYFGFGISINPNKNFFR